MHSRPSLHLPYPARTPPCPAARAQVHAPLPHARLAVKGDGACWRRWSGPPSSGRDAHREGKPCRLPLATRRGTHVRQSPSPLCCKSRQRFSTGVGGLYCQGSAFDLKGFTVVCRDHATSCDCGEFRPLIASVCVCVRARCCSILTSVVQVPAVNGCVPLSMTGVPSNATDT